MISVQAAGRLRMVRVVVLFAWPCFAISGLCHFFATDLDFASSPPTSKRIKTSATTSAPSHLLAQQQIHPFHRVPTFEGIPMPTAPIPQQTSSRKRPSSPTASSSAMMAGQMNPGGIEDPGSLPAPEPVPKKKGRTNTPWTAEEEQRLKTMRDAGRSWSEIAKVGTDDPRETDLISNRA